MKHYHKLYFFWNNYPDEENGSKASYKSKLLDPYSFKYA